MGQTLILKTVSDEEILATRDVMLQLRPNISPDTYLPTIRGMMDSEGYELAALLEEEKVRAVAGYRFMRMLYCGEIMYVDDLITDEGGRSKGYGKAMMDWLKNEAKENGCEELHLDTGVQREHTHRFYFREGLTINCYHLRTKL